MKLKNANTKVRKDIFKKKYIVSNMESNSNYKSIANINIDSNFSKTGNIKISADYNYLYTDDNKYSHVYYFFNNKVKFNEIPIDHISNHVIDNFSIPSINIILYLVNKNNNNSNITLYVYNTIEIVYNDFVEISKIDENKENISSDLGKIDTNKENISSNSSKIDTNKENISSNLGKIDTNKENISSNSSKIDINKNIISSNLGKIDTNKENISSNLGKIDTNKENISSNSSKIDTNKENISSNSSKIDVNKNNISTNLIDISDNEDNIAYNLSEINYIKNNNSKSYLKNIYNILLYDSKTQIDFRGIFYEKIFELNNNKNDFIEMNFKIDIQYEDISERNYVKTIYEIFDENDNSLYIKSVTNNNYTYFSNRVIVDENIFYNFTKNVKKIKFIIKFQMLLSRVMKIWYIKNDNYRLVIKNYGLYKYFLI